MSDEIKKNKKSKNKKYIYVCIYTVLLLSCLFVASTFASYRTTIKKDLTGTSAAWSFILKHNSTLIDNSFRLNLKDTIQGNSSNIKNTRIAPGSYGDFVLTVDCRACEVGVVYGIKFDDINNSIPSNLHFYLDSSYSQEAMMNIGQEYIEYIDIENLDELQEKHIYWKWDAEDTQIANSADSSSIGQNISMQVAITGTQMLTKNVTDENLFELDENGKISVKTSAVSEFSELSNIILPNTIGGVQVTGIRDNAFAGFQNITSMIICSNATTIGTASFERCTNLRNLTIPNTVTAVGDNAFAYCTSLLSVDIPSSVLTVGKYAFYNCTNLRTITLPNSIQTIGEAAFYKCVNLQNITLPNGLTKIDKWCFFGCEQMTSITIPNTVLTIDEGAYAKCINVLQINFGTGVQYIKDSAFFYLDKIQSITIPNSTLVIESYAFEDCTVLSSVTLPQTTTVQEDAFYNCDI